MLYEEMKMLSDMIDFDHERGAVDFGRLTRFVDHQLACSYFYIRRDWEETAGLFEDLSWIEPFMYTIMNSNTIFRIRAALVQELMALQASGRIGRERSVQ